MDQLNLDGNRIEPPSDYQYDFISGQKVKAGPEEIKAVQVFSKRLVNEYGYTKNQITTRPQFRIKSSPSGQEKYPIDIAVFRDDGKFYRNLFMIVECKKPNRVTGRDQLEIYMGLSSAEIGVWFNGNEHLYLQKIHLTGGRITYREIPNIPKRGQRIEDIGKYQRKDLLQPSDLKVVFKDIRNHLAGMTTGITMDVAFAQEMINVLFCKIYDEFHTERDDMTTFRAGVDESSTDVKSRIMNLFEENVKGEYSDIFDINDSIKLDSNSLVYVVGELQNYCITESNTDAIGDAFEVFIGPALRGGEGQFFTPRNVVDMMIGILNPKPREFIVDPACGSGGFLTVALGNVWKNMDQEGKRLDWSEKVLENRKKELASKFFYGIDKDSFLAKVTKVYMALVGDGRGGIFCENSLRKPASWATMTSHSIKLDKFDIIVTNPPFGSKIQVSGEDILSQYDLAKVWQRDSKSGQWEMTNKLRSKQAPQILFIERCIQFLKPGGKMGIILPESLFGNPTYGYVVEYLKQHAKFLGLVSLPEELFQPYTHNKTCAVFLERKAPNSTADTDDDYTVFMGIAKWCGKDSRGNEIDYDDVPLIADSYEKVALQNSVAKKFDRHGFLKNFSDIKNNILIPKYYDPDIQTELEALKTTHNLVTVQELMNDKIISLSTGAEIGKLSYGTWNHPIY